MTATAGTTGAVPGFHADTLERLFARCFADSHSTRLRGGAAEPLYKPAASGNGEHTIYYREDYFASALHEVAHWCIAGPERRKQLDFGYWYTPDGRSPEQQQAFERVEYKPQALEWLFSLACGYPFTVSVDNLEGYSQPDTRAFRRAIFEQAQYWRQCGLPARAQTYFLALSCHFGSGRAPAQVCLDTAELNL